MGCESPRVEYDDEPFPRAVYAEPDSHVWRSLECTIQVFGCAGCPITALSCPRAMALTKVRCDTRAACAASLTDRYPPTGLMTPAGLCLLRCMSLTSDRLCSPFTPDRVSRAWQPGG
jgi:hypothetical protein